MPKKNKVVVSKGAGPVLAPPKENPEQGYTKITLARQESILSICKMLSISTSEFDDHKKQDVYNAVKEHIEKYNRWQYSDISSYLFTHLKSNSESGKFITNIDSLCAYAYNLESHKSAVLSHIEKLSDHANLAIQQAEAFRNDDDKFKAQFDVAIIPAENRISSQLTSQLISLIAVFTAMSFIVFGGLSSLDNIFSNAKKVPVLELLIVGSIWCLCICNLVFIFMLFVSIMTDKPIRSTKCPQASLAEKYPTMVWLNCILGAVLMVSCWLYYVDHTDSGSWLVNFSHNNTGIFWLISCSIFLVICVIVIRFVTHHPKDCNKNKSEKTGSLLMKKSKLNVK